MKDDLQVITANLGNHKTVNLYGIGDWHIGSKQADTTTINATIDAIMNDKDGYCVICGDLMNNGLKQSKTNSYEEVLTPYEQKEVVYELLKPLADAGKILAITDGNHEYRSVREVGISPLYDVACRLRLEDIFRPYMCLLKISFGTHGRVNSRANVYGGLVTHGSTRNKHRAFEMVIDGVDFSVSGHTHQPEMASRSKIRLDLKKGSARQVHFQSLIVASALGAGGYGIQKEYTPTAFREIQWITLEGVDADGEKLMSYHTKQI